MTKKGQYLEPRPEALERIQHIVVLMLENRSFDNLLGWLYADESPPRDQHFEGLHRDLWNPLSSLNDDGIPVIEKVRVKRNGAPIAGTKYITANPHPEPDFCLPHPDPGEGFLDTNHQLFQHYQVPADYPPEPTNMGFVDNYVNTIVNGTYRMFGEDISDPRDIMTCYTPSEVPVLRKLAMEFAVCDHWFASVPSGTLPNRAFMHAATSCGQVNNKPHPKCDATTIFNRLEADARRGKSELSWGVFGGTPKGSDSEEDSLTESGNEYSLTRLMMTQLHDPSLDHRFQSIDRFYERAANGDLPNYAFLEPQFYGEGQNDQHPPAPVGPGEQLIAKVYDALVNSPQWTETLLVITYDEHGGCYDHVPPPGHSVHPDGKAGEPGQHGFRFNRFGVRVPTVLVSPWIEPGTIARPAGWMPFDHTSVIATVCKRFRVDPLTERDRHAPDLSCILTRDRVRSDRPAVAPRAPDTDGATVVNALHRVIEGVLSEVIQEPRAPGEHVFEYIARAYATYFRRRS